MDLVLNNTHRKYMGLKELKSSYELKIYKHYCHTAYVYFANDKIVKIIEISFFNNLISMQERDVLYYTNKDRTLILPKTNRGKVRKLTFSVIHGLEGYGNYFFFSNNETYERITIGNYTTQRTYYKESNIKGINSLDDLKLWCDNFVKNSTLKDLEEVKKFASAKRQHIKYREGDYFKVKLGRHFYTYGRILM